MRTKRFLLIMLCAATVALPPAARALKSDADQPIKISADRWDYKGAVGGNSGTSVYTGNVVITQGSIRITADKATIKLDNGKLQNALILGEPATFYQAREDGPPIRGHARQIHYDTSADMVELTDDAKVHQGDQLITANYIRYDVGRQKVVAHRAEQEKGRVHIVIPPSGEQ